MDEDDVHSEDFSGRPGLRRSSNQSRCLHVRRRGNLSHRRSAIMNALRNVLTQAEKEGVALGHFNVADLVLLKAVVAAAGEVGVPVLVGASEGERDFFGTREL